eukprot:2627355-Rhodomonas_salina.1
MSGPCYNGQGTQFFLRNGLTWASLAFSLHTYGVRVFAAPETGTRTRAQVFAAIRTLPFFPGWRTNGFNRLPLNFEPTPFIVDAIIVRFEHDRHQTGAGNNVLCRRRLRFTTVSAVTLHFVKKDAVVDLLRVQAHEFRNHSLRCVAAGLHRSNNPLAQGIARVSILRLIRDIVLEVGSKRQGRTVAGTRLGRLGCAQSSLETKT